MTSLNRLRVLEAMGYICAVFIGLALITRLAVLRYLLGASAVIAIIVVIRLLVMNVSLWAAGQGKDDLFDSSEEEDPTDRMQ